MFKAAVIGLGNIGFKFSLDNLRKGTWSHVAAYSKCARTKLVGVAEVNTQTQVLFKQHYKDIPVFNALESLMQNTCAEIISICTPTQTHYSILKALLRYPIKAIFCEKPLGSTVTQAIEMVKLCEERKVTLAVNHLRRWDSNYLYVRKMIQDGRIGRVVAVNAFYSGGVFNIGTHLFDTIRFLIKEDAELLSGIYFNPNNPDPRISGWVSFAGQIPCAIVSTGRREDLIFEIDVFGDKGRVRILDNGERIEYFSFTPSTRYSGYRELTLVPTGSISKKDRFVEAINDIVSVLDKKKEKVNCTGNDGLASLSLSFAMLESAKKKSKMINIKDYNP